MIDPLESGDVVVILGLGLYGRAVGEALRGRGIDVIGVEDRVTDEVRAFAAEHRVRLIDAPSADELEVVFAEKPEAFVPSPGVPEHHVGFAAAAAAGVPTISEFDMARWWDHRPIAAITGTDGKTTVTLLTVAMLEASGIRAMAVGNTETPLITAIADPEIDVFVIEASSFRLGHTQYFSPRVAAWLNFGPDHLDVHLDLATYERAKAKVWANVEADAVIVANDTDPVVMRNVPIGADVVTIGSDTATGRRIANSLVLDGETVIELNDLPRAFEHDITNTLAAAAIARALGATMDGIRSAITSQELLPHRIQLVATVDGVTFYNDSKATVPHAVVTALRSFDKVVLIAGGRNKGLDLTELRVAVDHVAAVVAMGEAAPEIEAAFDDRVPIHRADAMDAAVTLAAEMARDVDLNRPEVVLLSPGCASYDAYTSYVARGDDFIRSVNTLREGAPQ